MGLLRAGIERAAELNTGLPAGWRDRVLNELQYAETSAYLPNVLSVADKVTLALGGRAGGDFRAWLRHDVGDLPLVDQDLLLAIGDLGSPIATTNYDGLIEKALLRSPTAWTDATAAQLIIQRKSPSILHLHGYWENPESIVLGAQSYGTLTGNSTAVHIERVLASAQFLLFIGCGEGLADPNFESLRGWLRTAFPNMEGRHYRLCLNSELARLTTVHEHDRITPLPYGASHEELLPFLRGLQPIAHVAIPATALPEASAQQRAVEAISARARAEAVLAENIPDIDGCTLKEILIPPVLLPVSREQYVDLHHIDGSARPRRCQPSEEVRRSSRIVLVADETAGLTSALEWLVVEAHESDRSLTPVIVDFRQLGKGHLPLERQIRKELMLIRADDPLPRYALALDNLSTGPDKIFSRVIAELNNEACGFVAMGCRQGTESALIDRLTQAGFEVTLRYIGRLNIKDATRMARLIEPTRAETLAAKAMEIASRERLPRTPLTLGLLLTMLLLHGDSLLSTGSGTALLDAYVGLLLGRGDPHEDARLALDSVERTDILATLAEHFVKSRTGSVSEAAALECLADYFEAVGWNEDPIDVLENFKRRRLLAVWKGQVRFTQSSYLHLFAAKRAIESPEFRSLLYGEALYYGPIIRHYAALTRSDPDVLRTVAELLSWSGIESGGSTSFAEMNEDTGSISAASIEELVEQLSFSTSGVANPELSSAQAQSADESEDWFDRIEDTDNDPFPLEKTSEITPIARLIFALSLTSNVLRDSELVKDAELKEAVLHRTLVVWAKFVELLETDKEFQDFSRTLAERLADSMSVPQGRRDGFVEEFRQFAPASTAYTGIAATLSSRKLARLLENRFADTRFVADASASIMGSILGFEIQELGWTKMFLAVQREHSRVRAVRFILERFALMAYYGRTLDQGDASRLHQFLVNQSIQRVSASANDVVRKDQRERISQALRKNRELMSRRRAAGKTGSLDEDAEESSPP